MINWGIWHQRNQVRTHKPCCTLDQLASQAKEKLDEFLAVLPPTPPTVPRPRVKWKPSDASCFKINFDKAIFRNKNRRGIGVVVQDHTGSIIASLTQLISPALQPAKIEAVATA